MSDHSYRRVTSAFMGKPWAILPEKLAQLAEILVLRVEGKHFSEDEIAERIAGEVYAAKKRKPMPGYGEGAGVAVIPIYGVITPRADMMTEMSGGTSMNTFISAINQAASDPQCASILLEVDSPGGQVDMVPEAAAAIRSARAKKPVTAVVNTMAGSAAYWLASQASELVVSPSAEVGSIGVFAAHNDMSSAMEAQGVKTTLVSAGKYKTELSPYQPLTEEAKAYVQSTVDEYYGMFTKDVAAGRRTQVSSVRSGFGEGRMVTAQRAVEANMADRVDTFDSTLGKMLSQAQKNGGGNYGLAGQIAASSTNFLNINEILPAISGTSSTGTVTINTENPTTLWPEESMADEDAAEARASDEIEAETDRLDDAEPQEQLADLRRLSRKSAQSEREEYLSLLRRMTK